MARTRMVTRTINVTDYTILTININTKEITNEVFSMGSVSVKDDKALEMLRKAYETQCIKLVSITNKETHEECFGMLETDFLRSAKRLDPITRKLLDDGLEFEIEDSEPFEPTEDFAPIDEVEVVEPKKKK